MTKTQYYTATTLDGFIADEQNSLDWLFGVDRGGGDGGWSDFYAGVGAMSMGATTYRWVVDHEDLCEDPELTLLDFGFGDAEYKRRFGDRSWHEEDVLIYARRPRPVLINLVRTAFLGVNAAALALGKRTGVLSRIKNWWRSRLRAAPPS